MRRRARAWVRSGRSGFERGIGGVRTGRDARRFAPVLLAILLLGGCGGSDVYAPDEPVTIEFVQFGATEYYTPLVEAFESTHENVTIELMTGGFRGFDAMMEADVIMVNQNFLPELIEERIPVSLNAFISEDEDFTTDDLYASTVEAVSVQGQVWAIPYMADVTVMVYNKDLFDKYGVPYPGAGWTWQSFLETAQLLTHEGPGEYGYAYQSAGGGMGYAEAMLWMYQNGGRLFDDLSSPTRMIINDPLNVAALQFYADLIHKYHVAPRPGLRQTPYPSAGIEGGKYAMWMGSISDDWGDLNVGMAPLPRGQVPATFGTVLGLIINSEAEDPRACWEWVTFLSENPPPGLVPARQALAESDEVMTSLPSGAVEAARASLPNLLAMTFNLQGDLYARWGTAMQAYSTALARIQDGDPVQMTLDEAQTQTGF